MKRVLLLLIILFSVSISFSQTKLNVPTGCGAVPVLQFQKIKYFATTGESRDIKVYDLNFNLKYELKLDTTYAIAYVTPDDKAVLCGHANNCFVLLDMKTGEVLLKALLLDVFATENGDLIVVTRDWDGRQYVATAYYSLGKMPASSLSDNAPIKNPEGYSLKQNYPNPFNPSTTIQYNMPERGDAKIIIYDMNGRVVKEIERNGSAAGLNSLIWNGTDNLNQKVSSGVYMYQIQAGTFVEAKKMIMLK
jgi:hypothetical protein